MVTASHNPKDDNGYKLYWSNACQVSCERVFADCYVSRLYGYKQVISPHDKHIQAAIEQNQVPWTWDKSVAEKKAVKIETSISDLYFQRVSSLATSR